MRTWTSTISTVIVVGAVAALLIVLTVTQPHPGAVAAHRSPVPSPSAAPTAKPKPVPVEPAPQIVEIDFVGPSTGFALLCTIPGGNGNCQYWISSTTDGGADWSRPVKAGPRVIGGDSGHHIHFANALDGLMYGNSNAYVTHDAGKSWRALNMKLLEVVAITGTSRLWMVIYPCDKGVVCPYEVLSSSDGARTWTTSAQLPGGFSPASVAGFGDSGLLISTFGTGDMLMTRDAGATWSQIAGQCLADSQSNVVATADGHGIWQACTPIPPAAITTGAWIASLHASQNAGASWFVASGQPAGLREELVEFSNGVVFYVTDTAGVIITRDRGITWSQVTNDPQYIGVVSLSWLPDGEAWAADVAGAIWTTSDYGSTWTELPAQPPVAKG